MAKSKILSFLRKKRLLDNPELPAAECHRYGYQCLEAGWLADALDFFLKGKVADGLEQLQALALENGDAFLLERLLQGREAPELWELVAARAEALEKFTLARWAAERAGRDTRGKTADGGSGTGSLHSVGGSHADHA